MMTSWLQEPMEPIPEEGEEWVVPSSNNRKTVRKREVFTSEQVDTLISTVPKDTVPADWIVENEVVDPDMASSYMTESLAGPHSARGTTYSYTYESHYDNPPEEDEQSGDGSGIHQTHKVTKVTKVTTTRSVRQIPVGSPYGDLYFDSSGLPTPSPVVEIDNTVEELGIRLRNTLEDRGAPPPAPPAGSRYGNIHDDPQVPSAPGAPSIIGMGLGEVAISWSSPLSNSCAQVIGYQIEMRYLPNGEWERAHDQLLNETTCTVTNLETRGEIQFRVSAASRDGFGPPSAASLPVKVPMEYGHVPVGSVPPPPGKPSVISVDGHRATIQWAAPVTTSDSSPIAGYQVEYRAFGTADWMIANDVLTKETVFTFENLRPNGVYEFRIRGKSADGLSTPSKSSGATHIKPAAPQRRNSARSAASDLRPPGQPQLDQADMDWVKLEWAESTADASYIVEFREVGDPSWYTANSQPITQNCIQVEGLRPGSTYEFRVISVSGNSVSEPSEVSDVIALRPLWKSSGVKGIPDRPQAPEYYEIDGDRITICWLPAHSSLPVLGYDVEFRDFQQDVGWYKVNDQPVHACKMTVGDLIVGHDYQFRVIAYNVVGCSDPSEPSNPITIKPSPGDAKFVEAERFGAVRLLQEEMIRESPPLPERDDSPPPLNRHPHNGGSLQWRDPSLKEVIDYLDSPDSHKQLNASGYLQHLTYSDNLVKDDTREFGGIPKLINLLKHEMTAVQKNACACIKNLCFGKENDKNKLAVLDADGVRLLAALLQTTHDASVKEECTAALWNLSSSDMLKPAILEAATDVLVQQVIVPGAGFQPNGLVNGPSGDPLKHYGSSLFKNATGVLRNISAASSDARKQLRSAPNLIEGLVHFLTIAIERGQADSPAVENVVCIMRNLSYRIQEVEDPNYDPASAHYHVQKGSKSAPNSPKPKKKDKKKKVITHEPVSGPALIWDPHVIRLYLKILQEASTWDTLEASAGALQNLAACQFPPSVNVRSTVRVEKGLPVLVELIRLKEDYVVCAVATAMRNLALDSRNRELIGKYALRDLVNKLPEPGKPRPQISDQTIGAILGILFEIVKDSAEYTKNLHELKGTLKLRHLARNYPTYSQRICRYASQVLYIMWQHKELHDGFKRSGLKEADFYAGPARRGDSATLARPISSQGKERPALLDDTTSSGGYGAVNETSQGRSLPPQRHDHYQNHLERSGQRSEPLYASVRKGNVATTVDDSWV